MARFLPQPLVDAGWLAAHLGEVRIADVRWYLDGRSGREAYLAGHIPGAVWLDIDEDLSDPPGAGRHPLPSPDRFAAAMARSGIGDDTPVVAYDDTGGSTAARLWWLLRMLDHPAAVLDGGLAGWQGPLETAAAEPTPATFTARPFPAERLAVADQVAALVDEPDVAVVDARTATRYRDGDPNIDPRPGHIPGAKSAPWAENLDEHGHFASAETTAARYEALGIDADTEVIAYCGSGVTACHDLLALTRTGVTNLRLYPGSWSEWGSDPTRHAAR